jgi:hypothetical protein
MTIPKLKFNKASKEMENFYERKQKKERLIKRLNKKTNQLIKVSSQKLKLVEKAFEDNPEVYTNISDQIVQICMASLIEQYNQEGFDIDISGFLLLKSFEMSAETKVKYHKNLNIIKRNIKIEAENDSNRKLRAFERARSRNHLTNSGFVEEGSGCYIATMVYGDYNHPQVLVLRNFRDSFLANYVLGRSFIRLYYKYSPTWVEALKNKTIVNQAIKRGLTIFIKLIK